MCAMLLYRHVGIQRRNTSSLAFSKVVTMLSCCHVVILSCCHVVMLSCCHVVILSCCHGYVPCHVYTSN